MATSSARPLLAAYARNLDYARRLAADLPEESLADQPAPGMNHPAWVLGHLAVVTDTAGELLGLPRVLPAAWGPLFGRESSPSPDRAAYPGKAELIEALAAGHDRVAQAAEGLTDEALAGPSPIERFRERFPTLCDVLVHLLVAHEATHLGQLSAWRRSKGLPSV